MDGMIAEMPNRVAGPDRGAGRVRRRTVLYVHGFDPRGPAPYHRMFAEEAAKQAAVDGVEIDVGARRRGGRDADLWEVRGRFDGAVTRTAWVFLRWDDVVRRLWTRRGPRLLAETWASTALSWRSGLLGRSWRRARPLALAMLLPAISMTAFQVLAAAGAVGLALLGLWGAGRLGAPDVLAWLLALVLPPLAPMLALKGWRRFDARLRVSWLVQSLTNIGLAARERRPEIRKAAERIAERILEAAAGFEADEVLVVGHSYGAAVAVMALARALELDPRLGRRPGGPVVSFLTLGQSIAAWDHLAGAAASTTISRPWSAPSGSPGSTSPRRPTAPPAPGSTRSSWSKAARDGPCGARLISTWSCRASGSGASACGRSTTTSSISARRRSGAATTSSA